MRARILQAARDVFLSEGYGPARMDAVADTAGISKQTVYAHFGSKSALFEAMCADMIDAATAARDSQAPLQATRDTLPEVLERYALAQLVTAKAPLLMQLRRIAIAEVHRFPALGAQVYAAGPGRSIAHLAEAFARWHDDGLLHALEPARAGAMFNWMIMGGPTSEAMLLGAPIALTDKDQAAHAAEAVRLFLSGYGREMS